MYCWCSAVGDSAGMASLARDVKTVVVAVPQLVWDQQLEVRMQKPAAGEEEDEDVGGQELHSCST